MPLFAQKCPFLRFSCPAHVFVLTMPFYTHYDEMQKKTRLYTDVIIYDELLIYIYTMTII